MKKLIFSCQLCGVGSFFHWYSFTTVAKYDELFHFFLMLKDPKTQNFKSYHYLAFIHNWLLDLTPWLSRETHIHLVQRQLLRPNS